MESLLEWFDPTRWLGLAQDHPWLSLAIGVPLSLLLIWRLIRGGLGIRRTVVNVVGVGLVAWGTLWFADWVQPSLTADDLFTPPVVGPQAVKAVFVGQGTIERTVTYTGVVHPYERVVLQARTDGFVEDVAVYPGDPVAAGQVVVRIETSELEPKLEMARAELRFLQAEMKRDERLVQSGTVSPVVLELSQSKESVAAANVKLLETQIDYAQVRAPSDGWVSRRAVDAGQYVRKGDHLVAYDRLSRVRIRFDVAVQDLVTVSPGSEIILEFPEIRAEQVAGTEWADRQAAGYSSVAIRAKVTSVFPAVDEKTRLGIIEVIIPNSNLLLKSNAYVVGHLVTERAEDAWIVPERALTPMADGPTVIFLAPPIRARPKCERSASGSGTARRRRFSRGWKSPPMSSLPATAAWSAVRR